MTVSIPIELAEKIVFCLETSDLVALANGLRQFRAAAVEELIKRELPKYFKTKLSDLEKRFIICAKHGMTEWVDQYIQDGVNIHVSLNIRNNHVQAIHFAALSGVLSCVKSIATAGATLFPAVATRFFLSPLHFAAAGGNPACVEYFVDLGIPVDQESPAHFWLGSQSTALQIAAHHKRTACVAMLLLKKANVHHVKTNGSQAIHIAVDKSNNAGVIKLLLDAQADPNARLPDGMTPLTHAMSIFECHANIQVLLTGGANPREPNVNNLNMLPLQHLISNKLVAAADVLLRFDPTLIDAAIPPPPNSKNPNRWMGDKTALHIAVMLDLENEVMYLLEHKADTEVKSHAGKKAIDFIVKRDSAIEKLLRKPTLSIKPDATLESNLSEEETYRYANRY